MSCCFTPDTSAVQAQAPDAGLHVNYVRGLVLDVADFTQEFAYLAGRDQWLVRDAIGYGTLRGLQVGVTDTGGLPGTETKWKVTVSGGSAADPCGHLVCVPREQCGYLDRWLTQTATEVSKAMAASGGTRLDLHVVLSYADYPTQSVPIPGEPCRSEDTLKAPSRIADDFLLDFSLSAPRQAEEDGLRNFAAWLRSIPPASSTTSSMGRDKFAALVAAWQAGDVVVPAGLAVTPADLPLYLADAWRVWVTTLRPLVYGRACGCAAQPSEHEARLLLATVQIEVEQPSGQPWRVKSLAAVDENRRPVLLHARVLAERAAQSGAQGAPIALPPASQPVLAIRPGPAVRLVAAGKLAGNGTADGPVLGGLRVVAIGAGTVTFSFDEYSLPAGQHQYIVKVLAVSTVDDPAPVVRFLEYTAAGLVLRVNPGAKTVKKTAMEAHSFVIEVNEIRQAA